MNNVRYETREITPDDAKEMLSRMGKNRRMNSNRLLQLKKDMLNGKYTFNPSPICFDEEGYLIDGQHRLTAIVDSDTTQTFVVAYNVPDNSVIDRNYERNVGDALYMRGIIPIEMNNQRIIAIAKRYIDIQTGASTPSVDEVGDFVNTHHDELLTSMALVPTSGVCNRAPVRTAIFAALLRGVDCETLSSFVQIVNSGYCNGATESSAITIRNFLLSVKSNGRSISNQIESYTEQAIFDYANGIPRKKRYSKELHPYLKKISKSVDHKQGGAE